jgi:proteasome lid subunit RPN8/RPN11
VDANKEAQMYTRTLVWLALFTGLAAIEAAQAQGVAGRDMLPLRFARTGARARRRFKEDWDDLGHDGKEWAYCVTQWSIGLTQNKDTVFVIENVERVRAVDAQDHKINAAASPQCYIDNEHALPIAHVHPSGDCSPSRPDIMVAVMRGAPFELIICGPESTIGYSGAMYKDLLAFYSTPLKEKQ